MTNENEEERKRILEEIKARGMDKLPPLKSNGPDVEEAKKVFSLLVNSFIMDDVYTDALYEIIDCYKDYFNDKPVTRKQLALVLAVYSHNKSLDFHNKKVYDHNLDQVLTMIQERIDKHFKVLDNQISLVPKNIDEAKKTIAVLSISGGIAILLGGLMLRGIDIFSGIISKISL